MPKLEAIANWNQGIPYSWSGMPLRPDRLWSATGPTTEKNEATQAEPATDPRGKAAFVLGPKGHYGYFDFCVLDDQRVILHSMSSLEVDRGVVVIYPKDEAVDAAQDLVGAYMDWLSDEQEEGNIQGHLMEESRWKQNPFFFVNSVGLALGQEPFTRMTDDELRYGEKEWARAIVLCALAAVGITDLAVEHQNLDLVIGGVFLLEQWTNEEDDCESSLPEEWTVTEMSTGTILLEDVEIYEAAATIAMSLAGGRVHLALNKIDAELFARFPISGHTEEPAAPVSKPAAKVVCLASRREKTKGP